MTADELTILRTNGPKVTKTHTWNEHAGEWKTRPYQNAKWFKRASRAVSGIDSLHSAVLDLKDQPQVCVIRGRLADGRGSDRVRRTTNGDDAYFETHPQGRRWGMIDLDDAPAPDWLQPEDSGSRKAAVRFAIQEYLPEPFHDVTTSYHWSSSAGIKPWDALRLHLWFWFDRPAHDKSLEEWLKPAEHVDHVVFRTVQVHYTAAPIFKGRQGPLTLEGRSGLLGGERDEVTLPEQVLGGEAYREQQRRLEEKRKEERRQRLKEVQRDRRLETSADTRSAKKKYAVGGLDSAVGNILNAQPGTRHDTVLSEAIGIFGFVKGGHLPKKTADDELRQAAVASFAGDDELGEIDRLLGNAYRYADARSAEHVTARPPTNRGRHSTDTATGQKDTSEDVPEAAPRGSPDDGSSDSFSHLQSILDKQRHPERDEGDVAQWRTAKSEELQDRLVELPLTVQQRWAEKAAIMEYHGQLERDEAEARAYENIVDDEMTNTNRVA